MPRTPGPPTPDDVYDAMEICTPYTATELADELADRLDADDGGDVSRQTVRRRLHTLADAGRIQRKRHAPRRITWWKQPRTIPTVADLGADRDRDRDREPTAETETPTNTNTETGTETTTDPETTDEHP